jgi:hypothetical protein
MSMPIQRQSESFGIFDDGPRYARDRASADLPKGLAALINTSGPRIQGGMLDTRRTAGWHYPEYDPRIDGHPDDEGHERWDRDSFDPGWEGFDDDDPELESLEASDPQRFVPEDQVDPRTAARRLARSEPDEDDPWRTRDIPDERFPEDEWGNPEDGGKDRTGSRRPFDRTAACQACGGDVLPDGGDWSHVDAYMDGDHEAQPDENDLDNDEYGQGRDPAAAHDEYEHRMLNQARLAGWAEDNSLSYDDVMRHIDEQLAAGEPEDQSDYGTDYYHDGHREYGGHDLNDDEQDDDPYDPYDHRMNPEDVPPWPDQDWQQTPDYNTGYVTEQHHKVKDGRHVLVEDHRDPETGEPDGFMWQHFDKDPFGASYPNADGVVPTREQAFQAADEALAHPTGDGHWSDMRHHGHDPMDQGDPRTYQGEPEFANIHHPNYPQYMRQRGLQPRTAAPVQAPVVGAHGYQPAHRVGLPWRESVIPGTVIGLDGPNVGVRWDDGQYSTEEPHNIRLL